MRLRPQEMLRLYTEKKRAQRAAYKRQAEESRRSWSRADRLQRQLYDRDASSLFGEYDNVKRAEGAGDDVKRGDKTDVSNIDDSVAVKPKLGKDTGSLQRILIERTVHIHSPDLVRLIGQSGPGVEVGKVPTATVPLTNASQKRTSKENTVKCVEVRKHKPNEPLTIERTSSNVTRECTEEKPLDTTGREVSSSVKQDVSAGSPLTTPGRGSRTPAIGRTLATHRGVTIIQAISRKYDKRTTSDGATLPPLRYVSKFPPIKHINDKATRKGLTAELVNDKNVVSLAKLIKQQRSDREVERKRILDRENIPVYTKTRNGDVLATVLSFHRKEFNPPSQKESYFRYKMLRAQEDARRLQGERVKAFFEKIRTDGEFL